jgi:competence protein ComFC
MAPDEEKSPFGIQPREIKGSWDVGYVLDQHTISSTMIGYNEFGHPEFDTQRSPLGELAYRLKYKGDKSAIPPIVKTVALFLEGRAIQADVVVPTPPSKLQRPYQPVIEVASELSKALKIAFDGSSLRKTKTTPPNEGYRRLFGTSCSAGQRIHCWQGPRRKANTVDR